MKAKIQRLFNVFFVMIILFSFATLASCKKNKKETEGDFTDLSVRDVIGKNGVVCAASPYAAKAGLDILKAGGNAFDAAVAVSFALGVVEPNASGVGGGGILVGYKADSNEYIQYNFREFVPAAGNADVYGSDTFLDDYATASGVPTQVAGLLGILDAEGTKTRQEVMAAAIDYAENGFKVTKELAKVISDDSYKIERNTDDVREVFTRDGIDYLREGDLFVQKDYAHTLKLIAENGVAGFYTGEIADAIVNSYSNDSKYGKIDTLITYDDLLKAMNEYPRVSRPLSGTYKGYSLASANSPSSGGVILIEALNMLETLGQDGLSKLGHNSPEYINAIATALSLSYGDKRKYVADSSYIDVPYTGLTSKAYAKDRFEASYKVGIAYKGRYNTPAEDDYGNPWPYNNTIEGVSYTPVDYDEHQSTTSFSIADRFGNIVTTTQTINYFFGCGVVPEGTGFFMNNQLSSFSLTESSVHYVEPGKQPVSHIMPTIITKDNKPFATLGTPGGMRIPSAVLQVVLNMIDFDMDIQTAIEQPRIYVYAAANADKGASTKQKDIYIENAISEEIRISLANMGYYVIPTGTGDVDLYFGGVQGIRFEEKGMHGGADIRRDGKALGY